MLDYKNNTKEQSKNIDDYIEILEEEKDILENDIYEIEEKLSILNPTKKYTHIQASLFEPCDNFIELAAYEVDDILCAGEKPYSLFMQYQVICELRNRGVTTLLNLMQEHEFIKYNSEPLHKEFNVIHIPIIKNSIPSLEVLHKRIHIIDSNKKT